MVTPKICAAPVLTTDITSLALATIFLLKVGVVYVPRLGATMAPDVVVPPAAFQAFNPPFKTETFS